MYGCVGAGGVGGGLGGTGGGGGLGLGDDGGSAGLGGDVMHVDGPPWPSAQHCLHASCCSMVPPQHEQYWEYATVP